jgi:hypothetical protein
MNTEYLLTDFLRHQSHGNVALRGVSSYSTLLISATRDLSQSRSLPSNSYSRRKLNIFLINLA